MDPRQKRREKLGADKPIQMSQQTHAGAITDTLVPAPGSPQTPNHQAMNPLNLYEQPAGNLSVDGKPRKHPFGDSVQENDGRDGYVSGNVPASGTRQGFGGYRGQNMQRDMGQVMDTDASMFEQIDMDYNGMQALDRATKNYAASSDSNPSYQLGGMGMMGSQTQMMNPQLQEPPARIGQELGLYGVQQAQGINMAPVGNEMVPGQQKTTIPKKKGKK